MCVRTGYPPRTGLQIYAPFRSHDTLPTTRSGAPAYFAGGMHVLFIPKWYPGRNDPQLGDFIRKQALAVGRQVRVSVLFVHPVIGLGKREQQEVSEADGVWELRCYYKAFRSNDPRLQRAVNFVRYRRAALRGWARVQRERGMPDLFHAHILVRAVWLARTLARRERKPYLVSEQSSEYLDGTWERKPDWVKRFARRQVEDAARTIAVSDHLGRALVKHGLYARFEVVPNVLPVEQVPLPPRGPADRLMMVADLVDRTKNVSGVLRALALLRDRGLVLHLDLIGDGPDRDMLEGLTKDLGLGQQVTFHGRCPNADVLERMAGTGMVVVNSNVETFSVVTGEALTLGKPVVATRCGGPQAFVHEGNGLLVDPGDDAGLAEALAQVHGGHADFDPGRIRQDMAERFSSSAVGGRLKAIYTDVLQHAEHG